MLFVIGRALAQGRRAALTTVVGNTLGAYVLIVAVALGIGSVVEHSVLVFTVLKLTGAAYLVYLGVKAWRHRGSLHAEYADGGSGQGSLRTLWEGPGLTGPCRFRGPELLPHPLTAPPKANPPPNRRATSTYNRITGVE
nr:LysE family translocator [Streptomyces albicerus]